MQRTPAYMTFCYHRSDWSHICSCSLLACLHPVCPLAALQVLLDQSTKANSPLKGHERTVQYLQRLGKDQWPTQVCLSSGCQSCLLCQICWGDFGKASEKTFPLIDCWCQIKYIVCILPQHGLQSFICLELTKWEFFLTICVSIYCATLNLFVFLSVHQWC